jgi:electron transfer flavoprotein beta subunit
VKILVTVKRVIDPEMKIRLRPDGKGMVTEGVNWVVNFFDQIAVEEALRLKEKAGGAEIVIVSVGPDDVAQQIRQALAMGADRAVLVKIAGELDSDLAARCIAKVYEQEKPDLVLMGKQATDDDANQAGQLLAELLHLPQACFASKVELGADKKSATVTREVDGGLETIEVQLPAVITADLRLNEPRYASLPGIMKAKSKPLKTVTPEELGVEAKPKVRLLKLEEPAARKAGRKVPDVATLVKVLHEEAKAI